MDIKKDIRFRVYLTFTAIFIMALLIIFKAAYIQISEGEALKLKAQKAHTKKEKLEAERGNIYSEDGQVLSSTIPQFDLRIDFKAIDKDTFNKHIDTIANALAKIFPSTNASDFKSEMTTAFRKHERYWLLGKNVLYYQYMAVRELPIFNKGKNRGGFIVESKAKRVYPYGFLANRTLGLWRENARDVGLESSYDTALAGKPGSRVARKTTGGVWIPMEGSEIEPVNGRDIVTTIDMDIQDVTEHALLNILTQYNCEYGTAIVMETHTGKIRAMANLKRMSEGKYDEVFNYALIPSEPGSTFKLMTLYSLLEDGYVTINSNVNVQGGVAVFGNQRVVDDHKGMGTVTVKKAFAKSSNVAFAKLANQYYGKNPMKFIRHLQFLGLDKRTGIDLEGEHRPFIKTTKSENWSNATSVPWIAYGYESMITPLHSLMVYNAVANNGTMVKPYLVSAIREYGKDIKTFHPTVLIPKIGKESTIKQMQEVMKAVVDSGTAHRIKSPYYDAGGKTGTAQVADKGITYADGVKQGSFIGYFPWDKPQYTIAVVIRSTPHGAYYGAVVAAPVFKAIADKLYATHVGGWKPELKDSLKSQNPYVAKRGTSDNLFTVLSKLSMTRVRPTTFGIANLNSNPNGLLSIDVQKVSGTTVPDVTGMGLKDALFLLENAGIHVNITGQGKVLTQSIAPGNKIVKGQSINLQLGIAG